MLTYTDKKTPGIRTEDGGIKLFPTLLSVAFVIAAAVFVSLSLLGGTFTDSAYLQLLISLAMPIAGIALMSMLTASFKMLLPYCIISALIIFMGSDVRSSSAIVVFLMLLAMCAYLLRNRFLILAIFSAVAAFAITFFITQSFLWAQFSLVFLPASIVLYLSFEKKMHRVASVCKISATLGITLIALFVAWLYVKEGALSFDIVKGFFDSLRKGVILSITEAVAVAGEQLALGITLTDASIASATAVTMLFNLFPAIFVVTLFIATYVAHSLYISIISPTVEHQEQIANAITFKMSVSSAIVFLVAYFGALILAYEGLDLYAMAAENLYLILFPGLSLIAFGFFGSLIRKKGASCLTSIIYFAIFGLIFFIPNVAFEIAGGVISISAFAGAILVIVSAIKTKFQNNSDNTK